MAVTVKITVFWDAMSCSLVYAHVDTEGGGNMFHKMSLNIYQTTQHHIPENDNRVIFCLY
jgi:hypothetical protein